MKTALLLLILAYSTLTLTLATHNDFCSIGVQCNLQVINFGPIAPAPLLPILKSSISHVGFFVSSASEREDIVGRLSSTGIGPWSDYATPLVINGTYCGNLTTYILGGQAAPAAGGLPLPVATFWEVIQFTRIPGQRTFYSDYYDVHGPGMVYFGTTALPPYLTIESVTAALEAQNITVLMSYNYPSGIPNVPVGIVFAQIGGLITEIAVGVAGQITK